MRTLRPTHVCGIELRERFPGARVFMDMDSIEPGLDFAEVIREALESCAVLVALIGRQWATLADEQLRCLLEIPKNCVETGALLRVGHISIARRYM